MLRFSDNNGKIDYCLCVCHPLKVVILKKHSAINNAMINFVIHLVLTYLVVSLGFYGFENQILKLKRDLGLNKAVEEVV